MTKRSSDEPQEGDRELDGSGGWQPNRRELVVGSAIGAVTASFGTTAGARPGAARGRVPLSEVPVTFEVNRQPVTILADARTSLLDTLREGLGLTGAKKGCDHGQCGACTVHLDGQRVLACLTMVAQVNGRDVTTIEGIGGPHGQLHPMQQAFIDHDGLQCGYCTPGQIMSAIACVREGHARTVEQVREYMSGNLCRCGAYLGIVAAVRDVASIARRI